MVCIGGNPIIGWLKYGKMDKNTEKMLENERKLWLTHRFLNCLFWPFLVTFFICTDLSKPSHAATLYSCLGMCLEIVEAGFRLVKLVKGCRVRGGEISRGCAHTEMQRNAKHWAVWKMDCTHWLCWYFLYFICFYLILFYLFVNF